MELYLRPALVARLFLVQPSCHTRGVDRRSTTLRGHVRCFFEADGACVACDFFSKSFEPSALLDEFFWIFSGSGGGGGGDRNLSNRPVRIIVAVFGVD